MSQAPEAEEKPKSAKSGFGDDAKSVRSNKSAVSIRTAISVTLPTTAKGGAGASVEKRNMSTGDTRDATFPLDEPVPPVGTPTQTEAKKQKTETVKAKVVENTKASEGRLRRMLALACIERTWLTYRDKQMFKLLKHAVCAAEHSLSYEILRKVAPKEAEFLKDKFTRFKVRFRFGGSEFPPLIYFKIYASTSGSGMGLTYMSGKKMIQPASDAARDACDLMGARKFYDQVIQDTLQHQTHRVTDEVDVTTLKDYMQYLSLIDELPSYMGGKENFWRQLTLEVLPRQTIFYDVVEYLYSNTMSVRLKDEMPVLLAPPLTQEIQREHVRIISEIRSLPFVPPPKLRPVSAGNKNLSGRRSKQAQKRVSRMRKMYETRRELTEDEPYDEERIYYNADKLPPDGGRISAMMGKAGEAYRQPPSRPLPVDEEDWEKEADKLYEWTQDLSYDDLVGTPRLNTANTGRIMV